MQAKVWRWSSDDFAQFSRIREKDTGKIGIGETETGIGISKAKIIADQIALATTRRVYSKF